MLFRFTISQNRLYIRVLHGYFGFFFKGSSEEAGVATVVVDDPDVDEDIILEATVDASGLTLKSTSIDRLVPSLAISASSLFRYLENDSFSWKK